MLESVYEACLFESLAARGLSVERQKAVPIRFAGLTIEEDLPLGLLINFTAYTFKDGIGRIANNYYRPDSV